MNCNLKNKTLSVIALLFVFTISASRASFAADAPSPIAQPVAEAAKTAEQIATDAAKQSAQVTEKAQQNIEALKAQEAAAMENLKELDSEIAAVREELEALNADIAEGEISSKTLDEELAFLEDNAPNELDELKDKPKAAQNPNGAENAQNPNANPAQNANAQPANADPNAQKADGKADPFTDTEADALSAEPAQDQTDANGESIPNAEAPKSPLESFGNAILSKVDNNLFNKMSTIEKQTTLLRLEYKREELKNKVAALRTARLRAMEEEIERRRAYEEKLKNAEAERQAKILEEQRKLKEREMELEKLRQAKVLNEYMNEMLMMNQKWVEENAKLQNRIHELEEERVELINNFKEKMDNLGKVVNKTYDHVALAVREHFVTVNTLRNKIADLEQIIADKEAQIKALKEAAENPFGEGSVDGGPSQSDIDLSMEYAIMDITGQGDDIVAKLVSADGKTFSVHKGSMLKNGEVVTAITDTYISFENRGVKSYLYTGGSIREYEPQATFNGGYEDFFPATDAASVAKEKKASGTDTDTTAKSKPAAAAKPANGADSSSTAATPSRRKLLPSMSGTSGMFAR